MGNRTHVRRLGSLYLTSKRQIWRLFCNLSKALNWKVMENNAAHFPFSLPQGYLAGRASLESVCLGSTRVQSRRKVPYYVPCILNHLIVGPDENTVIDKIVC